MSPHAAVHHLAAQAAGTPAAAVPGGLTGTQYAVLGGCVVLLGLIGLLGLLAGSGRSGMATARAARRLIGETGLRRAAGQLRPSALEHEAPTHQQVVPGPRGPGRQRAPQKSAPAGAGGKRS